MRGRGRWGSRCYKDDVVVVRKVLLAPEPGREVLLMREMEDVVHAMRQAGREEGRRRRGEEGGRRCQCYL